LVPRDPPRKPEVIRRSSSQRGREPKCRRPLHERVKRRHSEHRYGRRRARHGSVRLRSSQRQRYDRILDCTSCFTAYSQPGHFSSGGTLSGIQHRKRMRRRELMEETLRILYDNWDDRRFGHSTDISLLLSCTVYSFEGVSGWLGGGTGGDLISRGQVTCCSTLPTATWLRKTS
jgi:hypothetical protein